MDTSIPKMKLLTLGEASPKLAKDQRYLTAILYLAGAADARLCPAAGECKQYCLITKAGRGAIGGPDNSVMRARKARTEFLFNYPEQFREQLTAEINALKRKAERIGVPLAVRLNGGSDLDWTDVYSVFKNVQFWEYTKRPDLAVRLNALPNVHMSYSVNEMTTDRIRGILMGAQVNMVQVFNVAKGKDLPAKLGTIDVIDGDSSDLRFLDPKGVIVGLRLKSLTKIDRSKRSSFIAGT
jgi:hypothetical protein